MPPSSLDLRRKIVQAYDAREGTQAALATRFGVSRSCVEKLLQRRRQTHSIAAKPRAGGQPARLDAAALEMIRQQIATQADATLAELREVVGQQSEVWVSESTLCRALQKLQLPRKKSRCTPVSVTPPASSKPATSSMSESRP